MGWKPVDLWRASMGEYRVALAAWNRAQGAPEPLTHEGLATVRRIVADAQAREVRRSGRA